MRLEGNKFQPLEQLPRTHIRLWTDSSSSVPPATRELSTEQALLQYLPLRKFRELESP
jgi:hypothetical protein